MTTAIAAPKHDAKNAENPSRLSDLADGRSDVLRIPVEKIRVEDGFNVRDFDRPEMEKRIEELMLSIAELGVLEPLTVRYENNLAYIINGECRYRATMLGIKEGKITKDIKLPCIGAPKMYLNEADRKILSYVKNTGVGFTDLELLKLVRQLEGMGMERKVIERKMGLYHGKMANLEALAAAPIAMQNMVQRDELSASYAATLVRQEGPKEAGRLVKQALALAKSEAEEGEAVKVKPRIVKAVKEGASAGVGEKPIKARKLTGKDSNNLILILRGLRDTIAKSLKSDENPTEVLKEVRTTIRETLKEYAEAETE